MFSSPLLQELWNRDARDGRATSAFSPQVTTPRCKLLERYPDDSLTPPPVPFPYKKTQLAAAKRLEKDLKNCGGNAKQAEKKKAKTVEKKKAKTVSKKASKKEAKEPPKKARKPSAGPMAEAMGSFVAAAKAEGYSHQESLRLWKLSPERDAIVQGMSESERKRRRY